MTLREWERFNEQDAAAIIVAAYTGLRRGEVTALKWADVDFAGAKLIVRRSISAQDAAGLERRRFHDLRHGFGSMAVNAFSTTDVQAFMGHARLQTTERYLTAKPRHDDAARLTEAFKPRTIESVESESEHEGKR